MIQCRMVNGEPSARKYCPSTPGVNAKMHSAPETPKKAGCQMECRKSEGLPRLYWKLLGEIENYSCHLQLAQTNSKWAVQLKPLNDMDPRLAAMCQHSRMVSSEGEIKQEPHAASSGLTQKHVASQSLKHVGKKNTNRRHSSPLGSCQPRQDIWLSALSRRLIRVEPPKGEIISSPEWMGREKPNCLFTNLRTRHPAGD